MVSGSSDSEEWIELEQGWLVGSKTLGRDLQGSGSVAKWGAGNEDRR